MKRILKIGMDVHTTNYTLCAMEPVIGEEDRVFATIKVTPDYKKKRKILDRGWLPYRINHLSWWKEELPSEEEMEEGRRNLALHDNKVDYIVTHCCSTSTQVIIGGSLYKPDILTDYLEEIKQNTTFKKWYFGHYHDNIIVNDKENMLFSQIVRID